MQSGVEVAGRDGRGLMSIYYGLRHGAVTNWRPPVKRVRGKRFKPPFEDALAMATPVELEKAIKYLEVTTTYIGFKAHRIERMKQRLQEIEGM